MIMYRLKDYDYDLPKELIAKYPVEPRDSCRLMVLNRKDRTVQHKIFRDIVEFFNKGDLLILNDTKVIPARLIGQKKTGAKIEIFLLRKIEGRYWETLIKNLKRLKEGNLVKISNDFFAKLVEKKKNGIAVVELIGDDIDKLIHKYGHIPLPPYIDREDEEKDRDYYQTVFAKKEGSVASPTAGLHFTQNLLKELEKKGVNIKYITLHVGIGTFKPITSENIKEHKMHEEFYTIPPDTLEAVHKALEEGKNIFAVGTTVVRTLETYGETGKSEGFSNLYIYPPYKFKIVNKMITNFHLPKSTLLLLVSAFAGREFILEAYKTAVEKRYRFFSYGDAMLIL